MIYTPTHQVAFSKHSLGSFPSHGLGNGVRDGDSLRLRQDPLRRGGSPGLEMWWFKVGPTHGRQRGGRTLPRLG